MVACTTSRSPPLGSSRVRIAICCSGFRICHRARRPAVLAAAVLYVLANAVPMLGLSAVGRQASTTVLGGVQQLWGNGQQVVAVLVLFAAVVAPALQIGFLLLIVLGVQHEPSPRWVGELLRYHPTTRIWSMIEVMLIGGLVALIKIADYATVVPGVALFALGGLVFLLAAMQASFDPREVWNRVAWAAAARDGTAEVPS